MDATARLMAIEEIKQLKAAYFRCMDTKDWDAFPDLFTEDASFDARRALEPPMPEAEYHTEEIWVGRDVIYARVREAITPIISVHQGHAPEIDILSATEARGIWPMTDVLIMPPGGPFRRFTGHGHYRETYRHGGDRWRIATSVLRRLYVESAD